MVVILAGVSHKAETEVAFVWLPPRPACSPRQPSGETHQAARVSGPDMKRDVRPRGKISQHAAKVDHLRRGNSSFCSGRNWVPTAVVVGTSSAEKRHLAKQQKKKNPLLHARLAARGGMTRITFSTMALDAALSDALLSARRQIARLADSSLGSPVRQSAGERRDETESRVMDCAEAVSRGRRPLLALNYGVGIIHRHLRRDNNAAISTGPAPWGFYGALVRAVQCSVLLPPPLGFFWEVVLLKALIGCYVFLFSENDCRGSVPGLRLKDPLLSFSSSLHLLLPPPEFASSPRHPSGSLALSWLSSSLTQPKQEKKNKKKTSSSALNSSACRYVTGEGLLLWERTAIGDSPRAVFYISKCQAPDEVGGGVSLGPLRRSDDISRASPVSPVSVPGLFVVFLAAIDRATFNKKQIAPAETL